ncbi:hypothetical protein EFN49_06355 [Leuconostoc citreum]|nr:BRO family protein [Leuconostoc citreum]MCT3075311.1 hypothetical protein [Leuconostoc citreum]
MSLQEFRKEASNIQNEVQTVVINDEFWFVGKDIANELGYSNYRKTLGIY